MPKKFSGVVYSHYGIFGNRKKPCSAEGMDLGVERFQLPEQERKPDQHSPNGYWANGKMIDRTLSKKAIDSILTGKPKEDLERRAQTVLNEIVKSPSITAAAKTLKTTPAKLLREIKADPEAFRREATKISVKCAIGINEILDYTLSQVADMEPKERLVTMTVLSNVSDKMSKFNEETVNFTRKLAEYMLEKGYKDKDMVTIVRKGERPDGFSKTDWDMLKEMLGEEEEEEETIIDVEPEDE